MTTKPHRPNVLIYFLDELRADVLGCYGHPFVRTPAIDRIASAGARFSAAYSNCPLCMPARNCFFTGRYPSEHGVTSNGPVDRYFPDLARRYAESRPLYAFGRVLRQAGYEHVVGVGKHHTGFDATASGFTEHRSAEDRRGAGPARMPEGTDPGVPRPVRIPGAAPNTIIAGTYPGPPEDTHAAQCIDTAMEVIDRFAREDRWALRVSIDTPHTPVLPPPPFDTMYAEQVRSWEFNAEEFAARTDLLRRWSTLRGFQRIDPDDQRRARSSYFGMTTFLDSQIARLETYLQRRGLDEDLLTILVADHGSSIGEHGLQVKGPFDTDDIARIPLIIRYPGRVTPTTTQAMAQIIDVLPTLAELLGAAVDEEVSGRSLVPLIDGRADAVHDAIFSEGTFPHSGVQTGMRESIRTTDWLYTRYGAIGEHELFDLRTDPNQTVSVADRRAGVARRLGARLDAWRRRHPAPASERQGPCDS